MPAQTQPPRVIDLRHLGTPGAVACFAIDDVIVDPGPESTVDALLTGLGGEVPRAILLTHIHFDHAGAAGALVERWPGVEVWVHERGAPHVVDPSRLVASATRLYGADMERLWGRVVPVPQENLRVLQGGERLDGFEVAYTPGHASHHVAYRHGTSGTVFAGDVAGVRIAGGPPVPPTPPPDIDLELWEASLDVLAAWAPRRLAVTHFGLYEDVEPHLASLRARLRAWGELARTHDAEAFGDAVREELIAAGVEGEELARTAQASPPANQWPGLRRYWDKRAEALSRAGTR